MPPLLLVRVQVLVSVREQIESSESVSQFPLEAGDGTIGSTTRPTLLVVEPMPYKFTDDRRHKFSKAKYRVTNWPEYDAALVRRGSLTVWFTPEAVAAWHAPATGERGGQPIYSAIAIETGLALRLVFHQPLRQTEGLLRSIADVLGIDITIPDHTTLSRRGGGLTISRMRK